MNLGWDGKKMMDKRTKGQRQTYIPPSSAGIERVSTVSVNFKERHKLARWPSYYLRQMSPCMTKPTL